MSKSSRMRDCSEVPVASSGVAGRPLARGARPYPSSAGCRRSPRTPSGERRHDLHAEVRGGVVVVDDDRDIRPYSSSIQFRENSVALKHGLASKAPGCDPCRSPSPTAGTWLVAIPAVIRATSALALRSFLLRQPSDVSAACEHHLLGIARRSCRSSCSRLARTRALPVRREDLREKVDVAAQWRASSVKVARRARLASGLPSSRHSVEISATRRRGIACGWVPYGHEAHAELVEVESGAFPRISIVKIGRAGDVVELVRKSGFSGMVSPPSRGSWG